MIDRYKGANTKNVCQSINKYKGINCSATTLQLGYVRPFNVYLKFDSSRRFESIKTGLNLIIFYFNIRGKLSTIRCDR